ncbi:unnamed protein product [Blepharisma stoltei]|uniref:Uncharacterized protein n=1 Tax=Blepharisma stoltei TaxID=1481888 RepID=A0AAU9JY87_9CILI|nr:unnamed protein product [Blepharisma stoltei]
MDLDSNSDAVFIFVIFISMKSKKLFSQIEFLNLFKCKVPFLEFKILCDRNSIEFRGIRNSRFFLPGSLLSGNLLVRKCHKGSKEVCSLVGILVGSEHFWFARVEFSGLNISVKCHLIRTNLVGR